MYKILQGMLSELQEYKRDKNFLKILYIQNRLNQTVIQYYKDLNTSLNYLSRRNEVRLQKYLNKEV